MTVLTQCLIIVGVFYGSENQLSGSYRMIAENILYS